MYAIRSYYVYCSCDRDTLGKDPADGRKVKGVIHWVSAPHSLPAEVRIYDRLFQDPNPGAADDFFATLNPDSLRIVEGARVEPSLRDAEPGLRITSYNVCYTKLLRPNPVL